MLLIIKLEPIYRLYDTLQRLDRGWIMGKKGEFLRGGETG